MIELNTEPQAVSMDVAAMRLAMLGDEDDDTDKGSAEGLTAAKAFYKALAKQGVARINVGPVKGDVFSAVTIQGVRLQAFVSHGLFLCDQVSGANAEYGTAQLRQLGDTWWVTKHFGEALIPLDSMSIEGVRAVAIHFGLPMGAMNFGCDGEEAFGEMEAFYSGAAYHDLVTWARLHPRKAKKGGGSGFVGDWGANATEDAKTLAEDALRTA